jgi:6-pyruvoyltetrahydropterin/6-carboxytetrahydropterin synthase
MASTAKFKNNYEIKTESFMLYVTKRMEFSASHRLYNPTYSDAKNEEVYDKCNNFHGHGHNYVLEVTVKGVPDPDTGYVIDLKKLKKIISEVIIDKVDHKHLNYDVDFYKNVIPTVENMVVIIWRVLEDKLPSGKLHKIKIYETPNSIVEYFGDETEVKYFDEFSAEQS